MDELIDKLEGLSRLDLYNTNDAVWLYEVIEVVKEHFNEQKEDG